MHYLGDKGERAAHFTARTRVAFSEALRNIACYVGVWWWDVLRCLADHDLLGVELLALRHVVQVHLCWGSDRNVKHSD